MSATKDLVVGTRTVTAYSSQMAEKEFTTSATTWGELQKELNGKGISYSGMKSVIGETKVTLEAKEAVLPVGDFHLFLMPIKTKSGGKSPYDDMKYGDLRTSIQRLVNNNDPKVSAKANTHFNEGKNYTVKGTEVLRDLLKSFKGPKANVAPVTITVSAKPEKAKAVVTKKDIPAAKVKGEDYSTMSYKDMRSKIKMALDGSNGNTNIFNHFNSGKNYTTKSTEELRKLLTSYSGKTFSVKESVVTPKASVKPEAKVIAKATPPKNNNLAKEYEALRSQFKDVK